MSLYGDDAIPSTNDKLKILRDGSQVGTKARKLNFPPTFAITENVAQNRYDLALAELAIAEANLADNSVTNIKLANTAVDANKLATNAVTTTKILDSNVTTGKIADNNVTTSKIADNNVTTSKILDGNVTNAKISQITDVAKLPGTLQYDWSQGKPGALTLTTADGGHGIWQGILESTGTYEDFSTSSTPYRPRYKTPALTEDQAGVRTNKNYVKGTTSNATIHNYALEGVITWNNGDDQLFYFVGLVSNTNWPNPGDPVSTWMTGMSGIGIWADRPTSANIRTARNDGSGAPTLIDVTNTTTWASGGNHTFKITYTSATPSWTITWDGVANTYTTDIPAANTAMGLLAYVETKFDTEKILEIARLQTNPTAR